MIVIIVIIVSFFGSFSQLHSISKCTHTIFKFNIPSRLLSFILISFGTEYQAKVVECKPQQLTAIGNRLLDWFSVIMADSKKRRQHSQKSKGEFYFWPFLNLFTLMRYINQLFFASIVLIWTYLFIARFPPTCKMESKWMFGHLDLNNDGILSSQELYDLEHDQVRR